MTTTQTKMNSISYLSNYNAKKDDIIVTDIIKRMGINDRSQSSNVKKLTAHKLITLMAKPPKSITSLITLITDFMREELGFYVITEPLYKFEDELHDIAKTWQPYCYYEMFRQMQPILGRDLSWRINDKFIARLDDRLNLNENYAHVQTSLKSDYGINFTTTIKLCDEVLAFLQDKQSYLKARSILDKHGLLNLHYHQFMSWWTMPKYENLKEDLEAETNSLTYPLQHQLYFYPYNFSPQESLDLINDLIANNIKKVSINNEGIVPIKFVID